ncbi:MAG: thioredoxin family protein [Pseudolysinimonas sp.]
MNKRLLVIVVVLAVVIGGAIGALALTRVVPPAGSVESAQTIAPEPSETTEPTQPSDSTTASTPGVYVDYSDTAIADAEGRVVLFFHAPWCGQCVQLEAGIEADGVPDGVTIIKVDWDTNQDLEQKYGVPMRTTFVELDANGEVVQRLTAYDDPRFEAVVTTMNL